MFPTFVYCFQNISLITCFFDNVQIKWRRYCQILRYLHVCLNNYFCFPSRETRVRWILSHDKIHDNHYYDVIMSAMVPQITSLTSVYSTVYSRRRSKKISKLRVTGLREGNSSLTGEFPAQRASNRELFPFDDVIMQGSQSTCAM